jgi:hypothetical protein
MNSFKFLLSLMAAAACALFGGCKKPVNSTSGTEAVTTMSTPVELKLKWQLGKRYEEHMAMVRTNYFKMPGSDKTRPMRSTSTEDFAVTPVKELPDGGTELEFAILGEKITGIGQGGLSFDSAQDPSQDSGNPLAPAFRKLVGAKFSCVVDAEGNVEKVNGVDEFFAQLPASDPQIVSVIKEFAGEDMLKQHAMRGWGLPDKPVKSGDHWPASRDIGAGQVGMLRMNIQYTLLGWQQHNNRRCALMEFTGDFTTKPGSNPPGPVQVTIDKGQMSGSAWFDPDLKMVVDTVIDQDMDLKISTQGSQFNSQMKQKINFAMANVTEVTK